MKTTLALCVLASVVVSEELLESKSLLTSVGATRSLREKELHFGQLCLANSTVCPASTSCIEGICKHKALLPLDGLDVLSLFLVFAATALAAGGGIGGGGLLVPIYLLLNNFHPARATALSLATISGGSVANLITYMRRFHPTPEPKRPLIDYDASLLFTPALLAGTTLGTMFSVVFPGIVTGVCMVVVLGYSGFRTLRTGRQKWRMQTQTQWEKIGEPKFEPGTPGRSISQASTDDAENIVQGRIDVDIDSPNESDGALTQDSIDRSFDPVVIGRTADAEEDNEVIANEDVKEPHLDERRHELSRIYERESSLLPLRKLALTGVIWIVVLVFALLRGGKGGASLIGVECGSTLYWTLFFANMFVLVAFTVYLRRTLLVHAVIKHSLGHVVATGDLQWTSTTTVHYPAVGIVAGILAGLLGIGGGMVLGPLLVALGCLAQPVAATSAYVVFLTATSGLCQVCIFGTLPYDYAFLFATVGLLSTFVGQTVVDYLVRKFKKDAVVVLIIGAIMLIALVLMAAASLRQAFSEAESFGFKPLCQA